MVFIYGLYLYFLCGCSEFEHMSNPCFFQVDTDPPAWSSDDVGPTAGFSCHFSCHKILTSHISCHLMSSYFMIFHGFSPCHPVRFWATKSLRATPMASRRHVLGWDISGSPILGHPSNHATVCEWQVR